jgi:hypothetical protein
MLCLRLPDSIVIEIAVEVMRTEQRMRSLFLLDASARRLPSRRQTRLQVREEIPCLMLRTARNDHVPLPTDPLFAASRNSSLHDLLTCVTHLYDQKAAADLFAELLLEYGGDVLKPTSLGITPPQSDRLGAVWWSTKKAQLLS